jgi:hypothetical protein
MNNLPAPIEVEAKTEETALIRLPQAPPPAAFNLFGASSPAEVIQRASDVATQLKAVVSRQGLISKISNREYPRCEAWTLLGTIVGVFPVLCWTRKVEGGWEARVEARLASGAIVGAAEAECLKSEKNWASRDDFALRSMAQTRATAKALRMPLGFVMTLAGYEATPAEEMVSDHPKPKAALPPIKPVKTGTPKVMSDADYLTLTLKRCEQAGHMEILPEYLEQAGIILPNENLADWPDKYVPHTKEEMGFLLTQLQGFANGDPAVKPFPAREAVAPNPAETPKTALKASEAPKVSPPENGGPNAANAPWRSFLCPFGKHSGVALAKLDKGVLFGFWANFEVSPTFQGKDGKVITKTADKLAKDKQFRAMLDEAGKHYEFEDKNGSTDEDDIPDDDIRK